MASSEAVNQLGKGELGVERGGEGAARMPEVLDAKGEGQTNEQRAVGAQARGKALGY